MAVDNFLGRTDLSRGLRNNNPGNLEGTDAWQGKSGMDGNYIQFSDIGYGIRAWLVNFHSYVVNDGIDTLQAFINKYAPAGDDNDPVAFANNVSAGTGIGLDEPLPTDQASVTRIMQYFFTQENGESNAALITDEDYQAGFDRLSNSISGFFTKA